MLLNAIDSSTDVKVGTPENVATWNYVCIIVSMMVNVQSVQKDNLLVLVLINTRAGDVKRVRWMKANQLQ